MIRKANLKDLHSVKKIAEECATNMISQGVFQWNEHYPSLAIFKKDIEEERLYVIDLKGIVCGCIMFSEEKDPLYNTIDWLTPDHSNLYLHRLAIHPLQQKKGWGKKLMDFAENYALENGNISIRLDTFSQNLRNNTFYKARGYSRLGDVYFVKQSIFPFHCYEKVLQP
ncbi:MAG: GNAT family N-acetyltransferase [Flavobacteriaceae bacterium]|nr:GNAT family N-acetyltransferase [Flavobacteriaceae bacterium]MDG1911835.1 GNAT family N-acetyltransferase [Flavobacteriaceae bacterium]